MTISSTTDRNDYTGNASTGTYAYGYKIFANTDLVATVRDTDGVETTLTLTTHYTVTGVGNVNGGNIVLVTGFSWVNGSGYLKSGYHLTIRRVRPIKQLTDIRNQGPFYPSVHEDALDHLIMVDQQQQNDIDGSIKLPETVAPSSFDTTLPTDITDNPGATFIVNADGDGFELGPTADEITGAQANATAAAASASAAASAAASLTSFWGGTVGGTADAITLTPSPAIASYVTGYRFLFLATGTNTGAATVAVSGLTAKSLKTLSGAALTAGNITSGRIYSITYDGTNFVVSEMGTVEDGAITNAKVASGAAIAYSKLNLTGAILNADLAGSIADSKLSTISTAGKVSGAALTSLSSIPSGAGDIPSVNMSTNACVLTGDQTIAGVKTFSSAIKASVNLNGGTLTNGTFGVNNSSSHTMANGETYTVPSGYYIYGVKRGGSGEIDIVYYASP